METLSPQTTVWPTSFSRAAAPADAFEAMTARARAADLTPRSFNGKEMASDTASLLTDLPPWVTIVAGGVVAAILGALLGGAMAF